MRTHRNLQCAHVVEVQETRAFVIVLEPRAINDGLQETGEPASEYDVKI